MKKSIFKMLGFTLLAITFGVNQEYNLSVLFSVITGLFILKGIIRKQQKRS